MANLLELTAEIVASHAANSPMTGEQLVEELQKVYSALKSLESGQPVVGGAEEQKPALTVKEAFKKNEVICMVCGKGGFKTLSRHLKQSHGLKPGEYRKQFGIPRSQSLAAKSFSEARRKMAEERGLADKLAQAREIRAANLKARKAVPAKPAAKPAAAKVAKPKAAKAKAK
jgi:predicted transcriptional regulator